MALLAFLLAVSLGLTLGWALRGGWRFSRSLAVMSGALLVALLVYGVVLWLGSGSPTPCSSRTGIRSISSIAATYQTRPA